ncbi:zinc finger, CCHC-type containing protein [Tanacetum coccineum]
MANFPKILRRVRDRYHNLKDDDIMKNIFNSGRHKDKVVMKIPDWMISEEMKHTEHYRMYAEVFGIDVPLTQSVKCSKMINCDSFSYSSKRSTRLTPLAPVLTVDKVDDMILQDTLQVSLAEHKSREEQEARENVELLMDDQNIPNISLEPRSDKESPERREKGKIIEESRSTPSPTPIRSPRIHTDLVSLDTEKLQELTETDTTPTPSSSLLNTKLSTTNRLLSLFKAKPARFKRYKNFFQEVMVESIPTMVDKHIQEKVEKQVPEQVKVQVPVYVAKGLLLERTSAVRPRDQDDPHDDAPPKKENSNQEQVDDYDFWTESYASDDDEIPTKQVSQDIMEEVSLTINEAELKKIANEMLRQRCTLGDKHQYHIDQTKNFLKSDIRDPEAPALSLINQDLLYLKKGNSGPEKIVLSLHKFPAIIFNYVDIEKRTSRWVKLNDIGESLYESIRSLVIWERVHGFQLGIESYQQKVNLTTPTISFPEIEKHKCCKPLGCKWVFKRKMKVNGTIDNFKVQLVIQGFRQKEGIDYFDTYAPIARITTIRLLLALATIHNLVIYQMDVKTTFLKGDLEEEVYMKQPEGFIMPVGKTKKFLSSKFSMKDMGEADVILGIKIKHENKGILITQSHYIEKIIKKFNHEDCSPVSTPMDPVEKLMPNTGKLVDQLEYSRTIGCLMYVMTSNRPDIAYVVGRLSKFTSNPSRQHWHAITKVFKYLKGTMNYGLSYVGYPLVLEAYSDASWINHVEDSSSTSGWVFLLRGGAISWAFKKQTCITSSTMESEFVALVVAGKEVE